MILVLVMGAVVAGFALSGALSPPQSFVVLIHVYDPVYGTPQTINATAFIDGVQVDVSGPRSYSATVNGVLPPEQIGKLPPGTYQIRAVKTGYQTTNVTYIVGPNCENRDLFEACHIWVAMPKSS